MKLASEIFLDNVDPKDYTIVTYYLESSKNLLEASWALAIGQSIGNPSVRNKYETAEMVDRHCAKILSTREVLAQTKAGVVRIAFPTLNINWAEEGITQLLVTIMGGQLDIDIVTKCQVRDIQFSPDTEKYFKGPKFGIKGIRDFTNTHDKPLFGGIIKPKVGFEPKELANLVHEMVDGGVNFIKEDEILTNPSFCPLKERVALVNDVLKGTNVVYAFCINGEYPHVVNRAQYIADNGGNAIHVNFWNGLGVYKVLRDMDLPLFIHFQKSGDKILTNEKHDFHIAWPVICKLAGMMGVDFIHAGMWGGYMNNSEDELTTIMDVLHKWNVMPALSCGMHAGLIQPINERFGVDYLANVGGAMHGHPWGTKSGARAIKQAIDMTYGPEYEISQKK